MQRRPQHRSRNSRANSNRPGFTLIELFVCISIVFLLLALLLPNVRRAGPAARRVQCRNNIKQIALALDNYAETHGTYPQAYTYDSNGKRLHSWRTLILPFHGQSTLHNQIDLSKPWDDSANSSALEAHLSSYICPESHGRGQTAYMAVVTPESFIQETRPARRSDVKDGIQNTLMITEIPPARSVHWMKPIDADESIVMSLTPKAKINHTNGIHAAFVDGSVKFLWNKTPPQTLHALITSSGGEAVGDL